MAAIISDYCKMISIISDYYFNTVFQLSHLQNRFHHAAQLWLDCEIVWNETVILCFKKVIQDSGLIMRSFGSKYRNYPNSRRILYGAKIVNVFHFSNYWNEFHNAVQLWLDFRIKFPNCLWVTDRAYTWDLRPQIFIFFHFRTSFSYTSFSLM